MLSAIAVLFKIKEMYLKEESRMYVKYPEELIEEIRINNDILDVVGEYVKLEKKGKSYFGLCPFHREKTP